jgi:hypothetical protein
LRPAAFLVAPVGANPQQPISQELVTFAVSQSGNLLKTFTVRTDINGRAALPPTGLPIGTYNVLASFAGSELYLGSSLAISNLQVTTPCPLGEKTKVRWHYSANGSPGNWTSDRQISCTDGSVVFATQATEGTLNLAPGHSDQVWLRPAAAGEQDALQRADQHCQGGVPAGLRVGSDPFADLVHCHDPESDVAAGQQELETRRPTRTTIRLPGNGHDSQCLRRRPGAAQSRRIFQRLHHAQLSADLRNTFGAGLP